MKIKILIPTLTVLLILAVIYIYTLGNEANRQTLKLQQQSKMIDSLRHEVETKRSQDRAASEMAEQVIARSQKEIDSLTRVNK